MPPRAARFRGVSGAVRGVDAGAALAVWDRGADRPAACRTLRPRRRSRHRRCGRRTGRSHRLRRQARPAAPCRWAASRASPSSPRVRLSSSWRQAARLECAGRPAESKGWESLTMKTWRVTSSPSHACLCREARGEALTGVCIGQPLSRDSAVLGADTVQVVEGNTSGCANASAHSARRGRRTWHVHKLSARAPGDLQLDHARRYGWVARVGKARSRSQ